MVPHMSHKQVVVQNFRSASHLLRCFQALGPLTWEAWNVFRRDFFYAHRDDEDLKRAHAVLCSMPVHFCLLLLPFNKPIISPFAFRFEGPYLPDKVFLWTPFSQKKYTRFSSFFQHILLFLTVGFWGLQESSKKWFEVLKEMDRHPDVVMGGTNMYDTMYNNHFLGSRKQVWLPVVAHYVENWDPTGWQHGKGGALTRWYE